MSDNWFYKSNYSEKQIDNSIQNIYDHFAAKNPHNMLGKYSLQFSLTPANWTPEGDKYKQEIIIDNLIEDAVENLIFISYLDETKEIAVKAGIGNNKVLFDNFNGKLTFYSDRAVFDNINLLISWQPIERVLIDTNINNRGEKDGRNF